MITSRRLLGLVLASVALVPGAYGADIDKVEWQDTNAWACAKTIAIQPPKVTGEFKAPLPADDYGKRFADGLAKGLGERFSESAVNADLVITGEFVTLTTGSRAKRFWVGFGAGKSWVDLRLHCTRQATGAPVFSLRQERGSAAGMKEDEVMENVDEVTRDVVAYLTRKLAECVQEAWDRAGAAATPDR